MLTLNFGKYKAGIHRGMAFADYAAIPAVNKSALMLMQHSPEDCLASLQGRYHKDSTGFTVGAALDDLMTANMTPEEWSAAHPVTASCQATIDSKKSKNFGKPCGCEAKNKYGDQWLCGKHAPEEAPMATAKLTSADLTAIVGMKNALLSSDTKAIFDGVKATQLVVLWNDEETGLPSKARIDGVSICRLPGYDSPCSIRFDLKTTCAKSPHEFQRQANDLSYDMQDAHYTAGANAIAKLQGKEQTDGNFIFAVACSAPSSPLGRHRSFLWTYDDSSRQRAKEERRFLMRKLKDCLDRGEFPPEKIEGIQVGSKPDFMYSHLKNSDAQV